MKIELNGEPADIQATTLAAAMVELGYENRTVASAVNGTFVPATDRDACKLTEGDRIEIVAPIEGG